MSRERFHRIRRTLAARQADLTVIMDNVHKPHNVAAVIRTCDAVGVPEVHVVADRIATRLTQKAASGSGKWVAVRRWATVEEACSQLRDRGFRILAAHPAPGTVDYRETDYTQPTAVLLGAELEGIPPDALESADGTVAIPMAGMITLLNVSVAAALILFEAKRQREAAGGLERGRLDEKTQARLLFEWSHPQVAACCRRTGEPYPELDEDGDVAPK